MGRGHRAPGPSEPLWGQSWGALQPLSLETGQECFLHGDVGLVTSHPSHPPFCPLPRGGGTSQLDLRRKVSGAQSEVPAVSLGLGLPTHGCCCSLFYSGDPVNLLI